MYKLIPEDKEITTRFVKILDRCVICVDTIINS